MFCPNCGRELKDGEVCTCTQQSQAPNDQSSAPVQDQSSAPFQNQVNDQNAQGNIPPVPPVQQPQYYQQPQQPQYAPAGMPMMNNAPATQAVATLRKHGSSTLFFVAVILESAGFLLSLIANIVNSANLTYQIKDFLDRFNLGDYIDTRSLSGIDSSSIGMYITGAIPTILVIVGLWLIYLACKNPQNGYVSTGGLTLEKVMLIISGVCAIIASVVVIAVVAILMTYITSYAGNYGRAADSYTQTLSGVIAVIVIFALIFVALIVITMVFSIKTINAIKKTAATGEPDSKISMYIIVIMFISGACGIIGSLVSVASIGGAIGAIQMLGGLAGSVAFFMIAMVLLKYRNEMSVLQQQAQAPAGMPYGNPNMQYQQGGYAQPQMQMTVCQVCGLQYDNRLDKCPQCGTVNSNKQN